MKKTIILLLPALLLFSCLKDEVNLNRINSDAFNPSFALPIASAKLQVGRLNEKGNRFLEVNPTTGILEFAYLSEAYKLGFSDIYQVQNQGVNTSVSMPASVVSAFNSSSTGTSTSFSSSNTATLSVSGSEQLDSILIQNGNLNLSVSSTYAHNISITLTVPSLVKNGVVYTKVVPLNYTGTLPVTATINDLLDGYKIDATDGGATNNTLRFNYAVTVTKGVTPATGVESIDFNFNIGLNSIDKVFGYFGNATKNYTDSVEYDIFDNIFGGTLSFADPRIELTVFNSTGIDVDANFTSITAPDNSVNTNLGGPGLTNIPVIMGATIVGDSTITNHTIDNSNTSPTLTTIMDEKPSKFIFATSFQYNPSGVTKNFVTQNSEIRAASKFVIPLDLYGNDFNLNDTNNTDIEDVFGVSEADADNINKITLRMFVINKLPIEAKLQVYFTDSSNQLLDSLFDNGSQMILGRAAVNFTVPSTDPSYGKVIGATTKTVDAIMTKEKYKRLLQSNSSKIIFRASTNTVDAASMRYVKIFPEDYIDIKLSAKLDLNVVIK